jgi:hypothetical protein
VSYTPVTFTPRITVWEADETAVPFRVRSSRAKTMWVDFDDFVSGGTVSFNYTGSTVTAAYVHFGDTGKITLTSAGTSHVTALEVLGYLARRAPTESYVADNTASQAGARGVRAGSDINTDYVGTLASARGLAEHVVWRFGTPQVRPTLTVTNWIPEQFELDLFDVISFSSPQLGVTNRLFEIVGLTHEGNRASPTIVEHVTTYVLQESRVQSATHWFCTDIHAPDGSAILGY